MVFSPRTDFAITASKDGHIKFWKKMPQGVEFVKHFYAHLGKIHNHINTYASDIMYVAFMLKNPQCLLIIHKRSYTSPSYFSGPIHALSVSADGLSLVSTGQDKAIKFFQVLSFDMTCIIEV